jgi:hypothetical protein
MTITARYKSRCARCDGHIPAGSQIEWSRGGPVTHAGECPTMPAPAAGYGELGEAPIGGHYHGRGGYECEDCGDRVQVGTSCWETGLRHGGR